MHPIRRRTTTSRLDGGGHSSAIARPELHDILPVDQLLILLPGKDKPRVRRWLFAVLHSRPAPGARHAFAWGDVRKALVRLRAFLPGGPMDGPWRRGPPVEAEAEVLRRWSRAFRWSIDEPLTTWITLREAALIRGTGMRKCLRDLARGRLPLPLEVMSGRRMEERGVRLYDVVMADRIDRCFGLPSVPPRWRPAFVLRARPAGWDPDRDRVPGRPSPVDPDAQRLLGARLWNRILLERSPLPAVATTPPQTPAPSNARHR